MTVVLSHPTGNTFVRAAARALFQRGALDSFHTTLSASARLARWLPPAVRRQYLRRRFDDELPGRVCSHSGREYARLASISVGLTSIGHRNHWGSPDAVYRSFDCAVARYVRRRGGNPAVSAVYCYEDAAKETFRAARDHNLRCVYELPIAYWTTTQRLLHEEAERLPQWRETLSGIDDSPGKLDRKTLEIELADTIVVPSRFVLNSLPAEIRSAKRCTVAPFGSPVPRRAAEPSGPTNPDRKLRVLFAGAMTQRKGLADLFAAMRLLNRSDVELVVMGSALKPLAFYREEYARFVYEPPRPHGEVLQLMQTCDVLVLPAIVEGRALVQHEALASGLPLVVTENAGGDDLVEEGATGFLVPIRRPDLLAGRLNWFVEHRKNLPQMRRMAMQKAAEMSWSGYETRVCDAALRCDSGVPSVSSEPVKSLC